ncbi:sulfurtransferase TusA family protein [Sphingobium ummariense]|nr:sulfurtransferase TusA family protein [Sphingobium ummariense]
MPTNEPVHIDARGMKCPWPALRAARTMREAAVMTIEADDPIAGRELQALARQRGWSFEALGTQHFQLRRHDLAE